MVHEQQTIPYEFSTKHAVHVGYWPGQQTLMTPAGLDDNAKEALQDKNFLNTHASWHCSEPRQYY